MTNYLEIAKEIINNNYGVVGVRNLCDDEQYAVGDECRESYDWDFENDCSTYDIDGEDGLKAGGTCAIHIDNSTDDAEELAEIIANAVEQNKVYGGKQVIIAGNDGINNDRMLDPGEIRIFNAFVIALL